MRRRATDLLLPVALALPVAAAVLWAGGYGPPARIAFALLAAVALATAIRDAPALAVHLATRPAVVVLGLLGGLGAFSAAWTVGAPADALRWGVVTLAYGAVAVAAGVLAARPRGVPQIAAGIAGLAGVSGVVGLVGVALAAEPFADRIGGAWRPGGTLEYSAALALLQVSALPALLSGLRADAWWVRAASAAGGLVAVAVLGLADSRLALALAALVVLGGAIRAGGTRRRLRRRAAAVALAGLLLAGAIAVALGADGGGLHGRSAVWQTAIDVARDHPVRGAGADAYLLASLAHTTGDPVAFAHDLPLELAAELGLLGLLLAVGLYGTVARAGWQARATPAAWLLGPAVGAFLVANLIDWPWHLAGSGAVWAAALGGLLGAAAAPAGRPRTGAVH